MHGDSLPDPCQEESIDSDISSFTSLVVANISQLKGVLKLDYCSLEII